jgi:hypothetical protein
MIDLFLNSIWLHFLIFLKKTEIYKIKKTCFFVFFIKKIQIDFKTV